MQHLHNGLDFEGVGLVSSYPPGQHHSLEQSDRKKATTVSAVPALQKVPGDLTR